MLSYLNPNDACLFLVTINELSGGATRGGGGRGGGKCLHIFVLPSKSFHFAQIASAIHDVLQFQNMTYLLAIIISSITLFCYETVKNMNV